MLILSASLTKGAPVAFHLPAPLVRILGWNDIAQIVQHYAHIGAAYWFLKLRERLRAVVAQLHFTADPMLIGDMALRRFVVDTDTDFALRRAYSYRRSFGAQDCLPIVGFANPLTFSGILKDAVNRQNAGMIVESDVEARHLTATVMNAPEQGRPTIAAIGKEAGKRLERAAALTGHLAPDAHVVAAVVMNADVGEVLAALVAARALCFNPRQAGQAEHINQRTR